MGMNPLVGYAGAYQDPVTGGYPLGNGYRMYLPELTRFAQPDSMSPFGKGGVNSYDYCEDDPINHADPSGHFGLGILGVVTTLVDVVVAEEEAANVAATVRGLVDEVAADGGLAAASAARAGSTTLTEEALPSPIGAANTPRLDGPDATGAIQSTASQLDRPIENIRQSARASINYPDVRTELGRIEARMEAEVPGMRKDLIRIFYRGNPSNRSLVYRWMGRDFTGGLRKAIKRGADLIVDDITDFADDMRQRIAHVADILGDVPREEAHLLPPEHWELAQQTINLSARRELLTNEIAMYQQVLNDFASRNLPQ